MNYENLASSVPGAAAQEKKESNVNLDFDLRDYAKEKQSQLPRQVSLNNRGRFRIEPDSTRKMIFLNETLSAQDGVIPVTEHFVWDEQENRPNYVTCIADNEKLNNGNTQICPLCEGGNIPSLYMMFSVLYENRYTNKEGTEVCKWSRGVFNLKMYAEGSRNEKYFDTFFEGLQKRVEKNNNRLRGIGISITRGNKQTPVSGQIDNWDTDAEIITQIYSDEELIELYGEAGFKDGDKEIEANWNLKAYTVDKFVPKKETADVYKNYQEPKKSFK